MTFTATTALYLGLLGLGVGAFGTLLGSGGGFILTPVLLLLYPHDRPATITAISLTAVFSSTPPQDQPPTPTSAESTTGAA